MMIGRGISWVMVAVFLVSGLAWAEEAPSGSTPHPEVVKEKPESLPYVPNLLELADITPVPGQWAKYKITQKRTGAEVHEEMPVVFAVDGKETVEGEEAWWFEIDLRKPDSMDHIITRCLYSPVSHKLHRLLYKVGKNTLVELDQSRLPKKPKPALVKRIEAVKSEKGKETESLVTPAGSFHVTWVQGGSAERAHGVKVAVSRRAAPLGVVRAEAPAMTIELIALGENYKSLLDVHAETPQVVGAPH